LSFGGKLEVTAGNVLVNGALTIGLTTMNIDGAGLKGVVVVGDTFTLGGESGSPVHTVTGTQFRAAAAAAIAGITFSPGIATGGVADNAIVTFSANSIAQVSGWSMSTSMETIDISKMGDGWRGFVSGLATWTGQGTTQLDMGDAKQAALINAIVAATPAPTLNGVLFGVMAGLKMFYAGAILSGFSITGMEVGGIATAQFNFQGTGAVLPNWA